MKTRFLKRALAIVLSVFLLLPCLTVCGLAADLEGYQDHAAADAIDRWVQEGIIRGNGSSHLDPDAALTRGQVASLFANLLGLEEKADLTAWTDLQADAWYADPIAKCIAAGILPGVSDTEMAPTAVMKRGDLYSIAAKNHLLHTGSLFWPKPLKSSDNSLKPVV